MRLLITSSRTWRDETLIRRHLDGLLGKYGRLDVLHGDCRDRTGRPLGGDGVADTWARERIAAGDPVTVEAVPAPWAAVGNIAGPMRNGYMAGLLVARGDAVGCAAYIRDGSRGASGCAAFAAAMGIPTRRFTHGDAGGVR